MKNRKPKKDGKGYVVNVSFTLEEEDLLNYVDSKGSFSSYVKYLIREDMMGYKKILIQDPAIGQVENKEEKKEEEFDVSALNDLLEQ